MANQEHLDILKQGVWTWNQWRKKHIDIRPDLSRADLSRAILWEADLREATLSGADLSGANLAYADLSQADLSGAALHNADFSRADLSGAKLDDANLTGADLSETKLGGVDLKGAKEITLAQLPNAELSGVIMPNGSRYEEALHREDVMRLVQEAGGSSKLVLHYRNLSHIDLSGVDLSDTDLYSTDLGGANLTGVNLSGANLQGANLRKANLIGANLSRANLIRAELSGAILWEADLIRANLSLVRLSGAILGFADLSEANLRGADLSRAELRFAILSHADLSGDAILNFADLSRADLSRADLSRAILWEANLSQATLVGTNFTEANLMNCNIYGISAWDVQLEGAKQDNLVITPQDEPTITVDNLKIAQFIYLLLNNAEIREVIDTITSKVVLILGRFTPERKAVLNVLRDALRKYNYSPIVFDFEIPGSRDTTETVSLLARMARFVIADLTDAKSVPQELSVIIPDLPSVPVQPLLQTTDKAYSMFEHWMRYSSVLKIYYYTSVDDLLPALKEHIIEPAEQKVQELRRPQ